MTTLDHFQGTSFHFFWCILHLQEQMVQLKKCFDIQDICQEKEGQQSAAEYLEAKGEPTQWPTEGRITFDKVNLRYRPNTEMVLKKLSFTIAPGEKVGIVGRTGAGKSTISQALSRIVETCGGSMIVDGVDISQIDLQEVRKNITVIAQDPTLFSGTIRFNLDPERRHSPEEIEKLCIKAGLEDLLKREPEGADEKQPLELQKLDEEYQVENLSDEEKTKIKSGKGIYFKVSEGGSNLSAGERQLLCICRAILRQNKIVLLDEATSNIDLITEQKIQALIESEFKESTVITIAHRLNTIIKSDKVLVLSHGRVKEFDSPASLMANPESEFSGLLKELKKEEAGLE